MFTNQLTPGLVPTEFTYGTNLTKLKIFNGSANETFFAIPPDDDDDDSLASNPFNYQQFAT